MQHGYTSLPGTGQSFVRKRNSITINEITLPVVPVICCLLMLVGLPMWATGMLQARASTDAIFKDWGVEDESLDRLKSSVLALVLVLTPVVVAVAILNCWLELSNKPRPGSSAADMGLFLSGMTSTCQRITVANWVLLLALTLSLATTMTWLTDMSAALSAVGGKGGSGGGPPGPPYWPPVAAPVAPAPAPASSSSHQLPAVQLAQPQPDALHPPGINQQLKNILQLVPAELQRAPWFTDLAQQLSRQQQQQQLQQHQAGQAYPVTDGNPSASSDNAFVNTICPPGCVDMGIIAQIFGLPWSCFCQTWLLADLQDQLSKVVRQLTVAVVGAVFLWLSSSWMFGYAASQGTHAQRDLLHLLHPQALGTDSSLGSARAATVLRGA